MSEMITINVQKWVYESGNYQIIVENAWNTSLHTQERITVNGVRIRDSIPVSRSILFWRTIFDDTVLVREGELALKVQWKSGIKTIKTRLLIDGDEQSWTDYVALQWTGPMGEWPDQASYDGQS